MDFKEKLAAIRKDRGLSQEELAERIGVSRQAVSKWESGESFPDIENLIALSSLLGVSIDRFVKPDNECGPALAKNEKNGLTEIVRFLCKAKKNTYAAHGGEVQPTRPCSHDLKYEEGGYVYYDTYLGGENFTGEEGIWYDGQPLWAMNYSGRVLSHRFSGAFLDEVLMLVPEEYPFRGPLVHKNGDYTYHCSVNGSFEWFQGHEEIFCGGEKVYECYFHGGAVK
jgi:transcriptional regulator with XRE-family HTH domain